MTKSPKGGRYTRAVKYETEAY